MRRRSFITLLGGLAAARPLAVRAQQPTMPLVALIHGGSAGAMARRADAFRKGLSETGYADGRDVVVEYHWLEGHYERLPQLLNDLVLRRVAVIATPASTAAALAAKSATATIPIVFGVSENPVALGIVASLARPSGNATGINFLSTEIDAKRLSLMHELVPNARHFALLLNPANAAANESTSKALKDAASALGLKMIFLNAGTPIEIDAAFAAVARERVDALFIAGDGFFAGRQVQLATLAVRDRLPASFASREMVEAGLLMSYGTNLVEVFRQVGIYTGSILKGAKPSDLPVMQATKFEFIINLQTARSLGLDIPPMLLARADEVIE